MRGLNLRTLHARRADNSPVRLADGTWRIMADALRTYPDFNQTRMWTLPDVPVLLDDEDFGSYLRRIGFSDVQMSYVSRMYANATGEALRYISARAALAEINDTAPGQPVYTHDYRILDGYDRLIDALAAGLDIRLNTVVESVTWAVDGVRVETAGSAVYEADYAIITLPLGVLQAGTVRFSPELPADKQDAINCLRMGPVIKMVYRFDEPPLPASAMAMYSALNPPMWWSVDYGHDSAGGVHVWTAFASGDWARELLSLGESGALAKGIETLRQETGRFDLQPNAAHLVNWPADPFAQGGYSVTPPGGVDARNALARSTGRLFWAGEAAAPLAHVATVHGAYMSGQRAAAEVLSNLQG